MLRDRALQVQRRDARFMMLVILTLRIENEMIHLPSRGYIFEWFQGKRREGSTESGKIGELKDEGLEEALRFFTSRGLEKEKGETEERQLI